jgi:acyl-CoA synthetase (AMP-forming)/AMP-acid ligase II
LSPRDPQHRLYTLTHQTQSRIVLLHYLTKTKIESSAILVDIDSLLIDNNEVESNGDIHRLSNIKVTSDNIAYVIFTSGSTGTPKAVSDIVFF